MCFYYTGEIKGKTMSLLHRIIFHVLMKNRPFYDPKSPKDYEAARMSEIKATARIKTPANVTVREGDLGGVPAQWISGKDNREDGIALYIHGGGFVTGSSAARKGFTFYVAGKLGLNVVSIDYRLAPEHPFPQDVRPNGRPYNRLGITAGKKIGNAVHRNRAKRLIRLAYRQAELALPIGIDLVIVARSRLAEISSSEYCNYMDSKGVPDIERCVRKMQKR